MIRRTILILHDAFDGKTREDLVDNRLEVEALTGSLKQLGFQVSSRPFDPHQVQELLDWIRQLKPALVFNLVEVVEGSGAKAHLSCECLDLAGVPYTGADAWSMQTTVDKVLTKTLLAGAGLPTPEWVEASGAGVFLPGEPYLVKPVFEDGSVGIAMESLVHSNSCEDLVATIRRRADILGTPCFAERFIDGREFNISVAGQVGQPDQPDVLPLVEMVFPGYSDAGLPAINTFNAKWSKTSFEHKHSKWTFEPRPGDGPLREQIVRLTEASWRLFRLRGYSRIEFRVDQDNQPWLIEVNTNPCITDTSGVPAAYAHAGVDFTGMVLRIAAEAGVDLPSLVKDAPADIVGESGDWHWQIKNRIRQGVDLPGGPGYLEQVRQADAAAIPAVSAVFPMAVTPYYASLFDLSNSNCPIRRQAVPDPAELIVSPGETDDPLEEERHSPLPGLIHRYPDRVLLLVSTECAVYCRHCSRKRMVGGSQQAITAETTSRAIGYIREHREIRDVLLSGGDPLMLQDERLAAILTEIRAVSHVEVIRIGTRMPVVLPQRITPELVCLLQRFHPLWLNTQFNHPAEFTPESEAALARLANAGIPLGNQSVLLKGINDKPETMRALLHKLVKNRVRPYYLYHCDYVRGLSHFRTSIRAGLDLLKTLQGHTSGFAVPSYVIDLPEGGGKTPLHAAHLAHLNLTGGEQLDLHNFEGIRFELNIDA